MNSVLFAFFMHRCVIKVILNSRNTNYLYSIQAWFATACLKYHIVSFWWSNYECSLTWFSRSLHHCVQACQPWCNIVLSMPSKLLLHSLGFVFLKVNYQFVLLVLCSLRLRRWYAAKVNVRVRFICWTWTCVLWRWCDKRIAASAELEAVVCGYSSLFLVV